ncbi:hypothetical protein JK359_11200 [Streptomyces actinomycinicus]|uniref:Uncharacterized protein n=1 Tax=Streptomyces actinomycinicus TaxID=1695166 RepID=A0A937JMP4_9ACTN|nr:hypothetical protein [Streptomyces actinomycinicus]MBL1082541.1 hypothetical protein [Streptomyces actinomycinicus]
MARSDASVAGLDTSVARRGRGAAAPSGVPALPPGRPLSAGVALLAVAVAVVNLLVGGVLTVVALTGHVLGAWPSPEPLSPGLLGAAMLGTAPALLALARSATWQEARTLVLPLAVVLAGLFAVSLLNAHRLYIADGGPIVSVLFSLGWLVTLGLLCVAAAVCLAGQVFTRPGPPAPRTTPLPGWTKPPLAVLGSSWLGIGTGLLVRPGFWADFVPWHTSRADAQALGVWALALGVGVLGSLAEDDLGRTRPALLSLPGTALAMALVLAARASHVDWSSGPGLSLIVMVAGLLAAGASGHLLVRGTTGGEATGSPG